ncbi:MAG: hypothetical protein HN742_34940 [Lentisphaerae bacterium]|jgi:hypothetical protein|nr:hypothetical protein [Lentisphaerota bacterium]MBT4815420.1 hypothetical protein [Lentisphaerota bacterium]MBT5609234.1 hypothetical protein [Lentisphaerota bacterium]MBT7059887.1 hypothetical protein [Lentisphaerota bacterium]MBT7847120.1 hypothetical protein [Lentisphaerota bacterium]
MQMRRPGLIVESALSLAAAHAAPTETLLQADQGQEDTERACVWYDIRLLNVEGKGWTDTEAFYDRLPAKAKGVVRDPVWDLSRHSAGLCVRFVTDATALHARWTLRSNSLAMNHMPATGVSGLDLYVRQPDGTWHWLAVGRPEKAPTNTVQLTAGIPEGEREFMLYLPLYNGVTSVELGIPQDRRIGTAPAYAVGKAKPIVFYGTSITQGGCASRPGMVHTAIVGRHLQWPVINLGFSGNGQMEPEVADLLAELDPAVFVLDCLPNTGADQIRERLVPLVRKIRTAHPDTPILLTEDRTYCNAFLITGNRRRNETSRDAHREGYEQLLAEGYTGLHYLPGEALLGEDGEDTVDGSHPTDLGFMRQAEAFLKALRPILGL